MRQTKTTLLKTVLFIGTLTTTLFVISGLIYAGDVSANKKSIVHKSSGGKSVVFPDVCKTPSPGGPTPVPYPNIGQSSDTSKGKKKLKVDGKKTEKNKATLKKRPN